jgi:hypothetical protein
VQRFISTVLISMGHSPTAFEKRQRADTGIISSSFSQRN